MTDQQTEVDGDWADRDSIEPGVPPFDPIEADDPELHPIEADQYVQHGDVDQIVGDESEPTDAD